jgi:hypothetical protein
MGPVIADEISPRLYMGPLPPPGGSVAREGFSTLVLCALRREYRSVYMLNAQTPVEQAFQGVEVFVVDLDDDFDNPLSEQDYQRAATAGELVKRTVRAKRNALVTCIAGRNRSGLVTALALRGLCDWPGQKAMDHVRRMRNSPHVLSNPQFANTLSKLSAPSFRTQPVQHVQRFDRYRRPIS